MPRINPDEADKYQSSLNGEWFQLKNNKDIATVQFMCQEYSELDVFACHTVKVNDKDRYVDCLRTYSDPIDMCPLCAAGLPVKPARFLVMYQHDDCKVKIWERGAKLIAKVQALMDRYPDFTNQVFDIQRFGAANDKQTSYDIFPRPDVDPYDLTNIEKPELLGGLILEKTAEEMDYYLESGTFPQTDDEEEAPSPVQRRTPPATQPSRGQAAPSRGQATPPANAPRGTSRRGFN